MLLVSSQTYPSGDVWLFPILVKTQETREGLKWSMDLYFYFRFFGFLGFGKRDR